MERALLFEGGEGASNAGAGLANSIGSGQQVAQTELPIHPVGNIYTRVVSPKKSTTKRIKKKTE